MHVQRLRAPDLTSSAPASQLPEPERTPPWVAWAKPLAALALLALAARWLHHELVALDWHAVLASARAVPGHSLLAAATVTALSYWILGLYDVLGLRYAGKQVVYPRALFVSFIANAFAHNLGLASLTGAAIRFRLYAASGLTALDIATVSTFCALTTGLGLATIMRLTTHYGGRVEVDSEVGRGTTFRLSFPSVPAPPARTAGAAPKPPGMSPLGAQRPRRGRILLDPPPLVSGRIRPVNHRATAAS